MKAIIFAITVLLCVSKRAYSQQMDCQKFRNGQFKMETTSGTSYIISRNGDLQKEVEQGKTDTASFIVDWVDDCTYTLIPTDETVKHKVVSSKTMVKVRITETRINSYVQISSFDYSDFRYVNEMIKIADTSNRMKDSTKSGSFPKYQEAVNHFFQVTPLDNFENPEVKFQKKVEGWFAKISADSLDTLIKVWDSSHLLYTDTVIKPDTSTAVSELRRKCLDNEDRLSYDACPYYGYKGWDKDVIKNFSGYKGSDAGFFYGIGRAYSLYADNLLSDESELADSSQSFKFKSLNDKLSPEQLETYRKYRHTAIECYKRAAELNSSYQTRVGRIDLKKELEYVVSYLDLIQYSTKEEAIRELPDQIFTPFCREFAYNLLMSCDKNAILFASGDWDSLIPLYLQQKEGIRKDVVIVSTSLLVSPRYCNYLEKEYGLKFALHDSKTNINALAVVVLKPDNQQPEWNAAKVFSFLNNTDNRKKYGKYYYALLPINRFTIKCSNGNVTWNSNADYIDKNQVLIADLIYSNQNLHPVYFSSASDEESYEGYKRNLLRQIVTYQLTPDHHLIGDMYENLDTEKSFQLATKTLKWDHVGMAISHEKYLCNSYRLHFAQLARELARDNKRDSATIIIDLCLKNFGNEQLPFEFFTLPLAEACYMIKNDELGNQIARTIIYNYLHMKGPYDADLVQKGYKDPKMITNVRELMNRFSQDTKFLDGY